MLRLEKSILGKFGALEMMTLVDASGLEAVMPDALDDNQLLLMSEQFRNLLGGVSSGGGDEDVSAALPLTLLLLTKAGASPQDDWFEVELDTLQSAVSLLNLTVDREIVNRILQRHDETPAGVGLMRGLERLVRSAAAQVRPPFPL